MKTTNPKNNSIIASLTKDTNLKNLQKLKQIYYLRKEKYFYYSITNKEFFQRELLLMDVSPFFPILFSSKLRFWRSVQKVFFARFFAPTVPILLCYKSRVWRCIQAIFVARYFNPSASI